MGRKRTARSGLDVAEFWINVTRAKEFRRDGSCWLWGGSKDRKGYGHITRHQKQFVAHRYAWFIVNGPIPEGMSVLHRCDNPSCVRPSHLYLGDHMDNMRDMRVKGRKKGINGERRGEDHGCAKLTEPWVRAIRGYAAEGKLSQREIGRRFNVTQATVSAIHTRRVWRHLP